MNRDHYRTPRPVFQYMAARYPLVVDVAASVINTQLPIFIDERHNALATPWTWFAMPGEYAWCNPPYSNIGPWVDAANEARAEGIGTVMLVMLDQSTGWFKKAKATCQEVVVVTGGRLSFLHPETGEPARGNNKGSMFLVWHPFGRGAMQTSYVERDALMACNDDPLLPVKVASSF